MSSEQDDYIRTEPPEDVRPGLGEQIPTLDEAYDKQRAIREGLVAKYIVEQASDDSLFISKERARNRIKAYRERIEKNREWALPCGFAVSFGSILFTLYTGTLTTQLLGWSQDMWKGIFLALTTASLFFTIRALISRFLNPHDLSIDRVITEMESFSQKAEDSLIKDRSAFVKYFKL